MCTALRLEVFLHFFLILVVQAAKHDQDHAHAHEGEDARGAFEALAAISEDTRPGVVVAPMGYWLRGSRSESTVNAVNSARYADMGRAPTFSDTMVEVTPVD